MGLTVGELDIQINASTKEFRDGIRDVDRRLRDFEGNAERRTGGAGRGFAKLAGGIGLVTGAVVALGGAIAAIGVGRFAFSGVQLAAQFESIGIALETLTGSAEGAAQVLEDVNTLVVETPFGLEEVATAARSVAVIFGENTEAVSEFTGIAADLAAAFGRPVEQIGENLTRSFSSGLGAADAFREAGITAEILRITGATQVADVSSQDLARALRQITAEGGKAFGAAAAQAESLEGALSNTAIAFSNVQRAFGEAIRDRVVSVLNDTVIPLFMRFEALIRANAGTLSNLAGRILPFLLDTFRRLASIAATVLRAIGFIATVFDTLSTVGAAVQLVIVALIGRFRTAGVVIGNAGQIIARILAAIGLALVGRFSAARDQLAGIKGDIEDVANSFRQESRDIDAAAGLVKDSFDNIGESSAVFLDLAEGIDRGVLSVDNLVAGTNDLTDATEENTTATEENTAADLSNVEALNRRNTAQVKGLETLEKINRALDQQAGPRIDALTKQANAIDEQIRKVERLAIIEGDAPLRAETLARLERNRERLLERRAATQQTNLDIEERIQDQIARVGTADPGRAAQLTAELGQALADTFADPIAREQALNEFAVGIEEEIPPTLAAAISSGITMGFTDANPAGILSDVGDIFEQKFTDQITSAFEAATESFDELLTDVLDKAGDAIGGLFEEGGAFSGLGSLLQGAGIDAGDAIGGAIGLGVAAFRAASQEADVRTTARLGGAGAPSAIESVQRVRGIVAGPTQIAIAQVDRAIGDAFVETNVILRRIEENTRSTARNSSPVGGGSLDPSSASSEATTVLVGESESLL